MKPELKPVTFYNEPYHVNVNASEADTRGAIARPEQFFGKTNGRKREAFTFYKGCIICSYTMEGTGWTKRTHTPYVMDWKTGETMCLRPSGCESVKQAKAAIDEAIETGKARD
jgi:hypothetical protein